MDPNSMETGNVKFQDGTTSLVNYDGSSVGIIGIDLNTIGKINKMVFFWRQSPFRVKDGYGMSEGLFKLLQNKGVDLVSVNGSKVVPLNTIQNMERVEPDNPLFSDDSNIKEAQYIVR